MLKAALRLKDALVLRCGGMALSAGQDNRGEWLTINYYDEDGTTVSERFRLTTPHSVLSLKNSFWHSICAHPCALSVAGCRIRDPSAGAAALPGFCCLTQKENYWQIREKSLIIRGDSANLTVWHNPECCFLVLYGFRLPFVRIFGKMHAASPRVTLLKPNTDFAAGSPVAKIFTLVKEKVMLTINAELRKEQGKGASRRLRRANKFPAIVYGGNQEPVSIELDHDVLINQKLNQNFTKF